MCKHDPQREAPPLEISRGAAMAHGCCGGFRPPQQMATVIPIETLRHDCQGDCKNEDDSERKPD